MSDIITSIVTGGVNNHATTSEEANAVATDYISAGVNGTITNTGGVSPATGSFAINQSGTPAMTVDISAGSAYITATPSGQSSQVLRARMAAATTAYAITANTSGSTKYDWIYLKIDAAKAAAPDAAADDVSSIVTSRSTSNSSDTGTPPTYGILLAVITVANAAATIVDANISDKRTVSYFQVADASVTPIKAPSLAKAIDRQNGATDATVTNQTIKSGWNWFDSLNGTTVLTKAITFDVAFDDVPIIICTNIGQQTSGTPSGPDSFTAIWNSANVFTEDITTSGFKAHIVDAGGSTDYNWGFTWIAVGTKAR